MTRVSPLVQLTMALVALASTLVILATLFLDVIPDRDGPTRQAREAVAEALAVQLAERLVRDDAAPSGFAHVRPAFGRREARRRPVGRRQRQPRATLGRRHR